MVLKNRIVYLAISSIIMTGCLYGAGTHGSIKGYAYSCKKDSLQKAIMTVVRSNPNISRDTSLDYLGSDPLLDSTDSWRGGGAENYYNDIKHYLTIKIKSGTEVNEYTIRYYGPDKDWKTLNTSEVFICYAYDDHRDGGSDGNGGLNWQKPRLKKKLTSVFETELILKVDSILNITHTDPE